MQAIIFGAMFLAWSVAVVLSAVRKPAVARVLLAALFISMGVVNMIAALTNPRAYTDLYGDRARIPFYRSILNSFIADHSQSIVIPVALAQITAGILLLIRRLEVLALIGMIVFLVIIVPHGPQVIINLIFAAGAALLLRKHFKAPKIKEPWPARRPRIRGKGEGQGGRIAVAIGVFLLMCLIAVRGEPAVANVASKPRSTPE